MVELHSRVAALAVLHSIISLRHELNFGLEISLPLFQSRWGIMRPRSTISDICISILYAYKTHKAHAGYYKVPSYKYKILNGRARYLLSQLYSFDI